MSATAPPAAHARSRMLQVAVYAIAMGWLEAVVVIYLRVLLGIAPGQGYPPFAAMMQRFQAFDRLLAIEQGREAASLIMLIAIGALSARRWPGRLGGFLLAFGVWDLAYYVALRVLIGWPTSLGQLDLLFLIPPLAWWVQPVWVPALIAALMALAGAKLLANDGSPRPTAAA